MHAGSKAGSWRFSAYGLYLRIIPTSSRRTRRPTTLMVKCSLKANLVAPDFWRYFNTGNMDRSSTGSDDLVKERENKQRRCC